MFFEGITEDCKGGKYLPSPEPTDPTTGPQYAKMAATASACPIYFEIMFPFNVMAIQRAKSRLVQYDKSASSITKISLIKGARNAWPRRNVKL